MKALLLKEIIQDQAEEFSILSRNSYIERNEEKLIDLNSTLAQVVIGVRRSGKSTLCINAIKKSGLKFAYINFDDERLDGIDAEGLNQLLESLYSIYGDFNHLFIDEIQNVNKWHLFINRLLRQGMHILLTGSNAKLLSGELATHLTGRHITIELFPFSFSEYCRIRDIDARTATTRERGLLQGIFYTYLKEGGFPDLIKATRKTAYIDTLVNSIISTDIINRYSIRYKTAFMQLAQFLLDNAPAIVNYKEIQGIFKITDHTAENYVEYLSNAYLISKLHKYSPKSKLRIRGEKAYAIDVALMDKRKDAFSGSNLGWRLETIVYIELIRRYRPLGYDIYYYREQAMEIDFLVCNGNTVLQLIQVSYDISNEKTRKREIDALISASRSTACTNLLLITALDEEEYTTKNHRILIVPAYKWLVDGEEHSLSTIHD